MNPTTCQSECALLSFLPTLSARSLIPSIVVRSKPAQCYRNLIPSPTVIRKHKIECDLGTTFNMLLGDISSLSKRSKREMKFRYSNFLVFFLFDFQSQTTGCVAVFV